MPHSPFVRGDKYRDCKKARVQLEMRQEQLSRDRSACESDLTRCRQLVPWYDVFPKPNDAADVKRRFRDLSMILHPDKIRTNPTTLLQKPLVQDAFLKLFRSMLRFVREETGVQAGGGKHRRRSPRRC